jgi:pyruvate ferredoxin oxidoreductase beta subunit/2-oxoisovalerate ferredoxin oxidoreductase beta subunit
MFDLTIEDNPHINAGHPACAGCGATISMNMASKHFPEKSVVVIPACCWSVIAGPYPLRTMNFPAIHTAFATGGAMATGIHFGMKARGEEDFRVIVWAGDGGTFDIGLQSLSGALERNVPFTYVCYDNEAYMNTGIQRSSATPIFASTTTTPAPDLKEHPKKDFMEIVAAHNIPYAATATIAFPDDLQKKVKKAMKVDGPSVLHLFSPCPTGQGFAEKYSVKFSRLAVETGVFPLYEYERGKYNITYEPSFEPLENYLDMQSRFRGMKKEQIQAMKEEIGKKWELLRNKERYL